MIELTDGDKWAIVENLIANHHSYQQRIENGDFPGLLSEEVCREGMQEMADLLDKLSPNWREADSCADVETYAIRVDKDKKGGTDRD
ncbi:hypothetical protein G3I44_14300 [Halogeometricum borinquense]|uniref:Uncharacterized protein n=1 Tax=Halogeometricum borinquense TaxID=60847 RepID=A0A6C0UJG4_9EURY|nr:hypothetical protein [Halogeometricum borinquense]QIB75357.1 hypothetical protein G3I44_14300 [Halogeometricum borinquense]